MIRIVQRKLIIPQGDTGDFSIPTQGAVSAGDVAILAIYDNLTHTTKLEKKIDATAETLVFNFTTEDTINIEPTDNSNRYSWDIVIKRNPQYDNENQITGYEFVDSYYAAYKLPPCIIKRVTRNVQE